MTQGALLDVRNLVKHYPVRSGPLGRQVARIHAVDGVDLTIAPGETLAVVGESGCGKSTLGRLILALTPADEGTIALEGERIEKLPVKQMRPLRRKLQVVFQDPFSSLNPRLRVRDIIAEPMDNYHLAANRADREIRLRRLIEQVGLRADALDRFPHEFSGGQRQRICIARALASEASLIVCDEAVSALDVSVKAQIVNLLADIQTELGVGMLFISHDLAIVENLAHRVAVMYLGKIVEIGDRRQIFGGAFHPYTQVLLSAVPVPDPSRRRQRIALSGDLPSPINPPSGCRFRTRCPYAFERCSREEPLLRPIRDGLLAACHLPVGADRAPTSTLTPACNL